MGVNGECSGVELPNLVFRYDFSYFRGCVCRVHGRHRGSDLYELASSCTIQYNSITHPCVKISNAFNHQVHLPSSGMITHRGRPYSW